MKSEFEEYPNLNDRQVLELQRLLANHSVERMRKNLYHVFFGYLKLGPETDTYEFTSIASDIYQILGFLEKMNTLKSPTVQESEIPLQDP